MQPVAERAGIAALRDADLVQRAAGGEMTAFETRRGLTRAPWTTSATLGNAAERTTSPGTRSWRPGDTSQLSATPPSSVPG